MSSAIIRRFRFGSTRCGVEAGEAAGEIRDDRDGSGRSGSSGTFRSEAGGLPNSREFCFGLPSSNGEIFFGGCSTGEGVEDCDGVKVGIGARAGIDVDLGVGVCVSVGLGVGVGIGVGVRARVGVGVGVAVGVGDRARDGIGKGVGDRDSVGDGEGCSTNGSSVDSVSVTLADCSFGAPDGVRLAVDPGSDQPPTWLPSAKVVCNRV